MVKLTFNTRLDDFIGMKNLDIKSFLIGFLFASTLLLAIGASKGTQDVRIVGVDKNFGDWDAIMVEPK